MRSGANRERFQQSAGVPQAAAGRRAFAGLVVASLFVAASCATGCAVDLSGTWASLKVLSDSVTFPLVGELERTTTLLQHLSVLQTGGDLTIRSTYCSVAFDNGPQLTTTVDASFVRSRPPLVLAATLGAGAAPAEFAQAWSTEVHGARLENPQTDSLPTYAGDPRVVDEDGDGKPGITVRACASGLITGDVYVVQRLRTRLVGRVISSDRIEGHVEGAVEQVVLGASNPLFVRAITSRPDPSPSRSPFVMQRIDAAWTCAEILAHRGALFDRQP